MRKEYCNFCKNKENCNNCNKDKNNFIPNDDIKEYFERLYNGREYMYHFRTTNTTLVPTHAIWIDGTAYCPYCSEKMFYIQDPDNYDLILPRLKHVGFLYNI